VCDDRWHFVAATFDGGDAAVLRGRLLEAAGFAGRIVAGTAAEYRRERRRRATAAATRTSAALTKRS
jgi:hypothetical protein